MVGQRFSSVDSIFTRIGKPSARYWKHATRQFDNWTWDHEISRFDTLYRYAFIAHRNNRCGQIPEIFVLSLVLACHCQRCESQQCGASLASVKFCMRKIVSLPSKFVTAAVLDEVSSFMSLSFTLAGLRYMTAP